MEIRVPPQFAAETAVREGEAGRAWVEALPGLFASLCGRWGLDPDGPVMHGSNGLVVLVRRGGEPCALKVARPGPATSAEAAALRAWAGRGAVRLLEADPEAGALLLERLDHRRPLRDVEIGEAVRIAGGLLRRLAIPAPGGFRHVREQTGHLPQTLPPLWERLGRPLPGGLLGQVCEMVGPLNSGAVNLLVNYDLHWENVYAAGREPWLAADPMVVVGDPEFAVAPLLWWRLEDIQEDGGLDRHFPALVEAAGLDPELARAWTLVRTVEYWLWGLEHGLTTDPPRCAQVVKWLTGSG